MQMEIKIRDLRKPEFFRVDNRFLDNYARAIGVYAVGVYLSLCRHAFNERWPSIQEISDELNISNPKIYQAIETLQMFGIIKKERIGKCEKNIYYLIDRDEWLGKEAVDNLLKSGASDVNDVNISSKPRLHHQLTTFTSYIKAKNVLKTYKKQETASRSAVDNSQKDEKQEELEALKKQIFDSGFNIYQFEEWIKKEYRKDFNLPAEVLLRIYRRFLDTDRPKIENIWPWFARILKHEIALYNAAAEEKINNARKEDKSIAGILSVIAAKMAANQKGGAK